MHAISNQSRRLIHWFARQQRARQHFFLVQNLIFGADAMRYLFFRTRYTIAMALFRVMLHIVEIGLLAYVMPHFVYHAMMYRLFSLMMENGWWGMTESMRQRIRLFRRQHNLGGIQQEIQAWLTMALIVSVLIMGGFIAALLWGEARSLPVQALIIAIGMQTAIKIIGRTFYSGAYALRRVFFPIELFVGVEILIFVLGIFLSPMLGKWTVTVIIVVSTLIVAVASYRYVKQVMDFLRITPARFFAPRAFLRVFAEHSPMLLVSPALSALFVRLHDVLLMGMLQWLAVGDPQLRKLLFPIYLVLPFLRSCMNWARPLYFDLSKYHLDVFLRFRSTFERIGAFYSLLLSLVFCAMTMLVVYLYASGTFTQVVALIVPYMIVSAVLGFVLTSLFSQRRYVLVTLLCLIQYATLWELLVRRAGQMPLAEGMLLSLAAPLLLGWLCQRMRWQPPADLVESYFPFVSKLCRRTQPVMLVRLTMHPSVRNKILGRVAFDIATTLNTALVCQHGRAVLLAIDGPAGQEMALRESLLHFGSGMIMSIEMFAGANGVEAYGKMRPEPATYAIATPEAMVAEFRARFPSGYVQVPMQHNSTLFAATSEADRREILYNARQGAGIRLKRISRRWFVTSLYTDPGISAILVVPKKEAPEEARRAWLEAVDSFNLAALERKYLTGRAGS